VNDLRMLKTSVWPIYKKKLAGNLRESEGLLNKSFLVYSPALENVSESLSLS